MFELFKLELTSSLVRHEKKNNDRFLKDCFSSSLSIAFDQNEEECASTLDRAHKCAKFLLSIFLTYTGHSPKNIDLLSFTYTWSALK